MRCPTCRKTISEQRPATGQRSYFPFCSERCKLVDLGKWLDGKYQIPVEADDKDEQQYEDPALGDHPDGERP